MSQRPRRCLQFWADTQRGRFFWHFDEAAIGVYIVGNGAGTTVQVEPEAAEALDRLLSGERCIDLLYQHAPALVRAITGPDARIPQGPDLHRLVWSALIVPVWAMVERLGEAIRAQEPEAQPPRMG